MIVRTKDKKNIFITGIFVIVILVITMAFIAMLSKESALFESKINISTVVKNISNLKLGAAVQLKGMKIGSVSDITFIDVDKIRITSSVKESVSKWIRKDSIIEIRTQGVLGDKYVEILGGTKEAAPIDDNEELTANESTIVTKLMDRGEDMVVTASSVLRKLDLLLVQFDKTLRETNSFLTKMNKIDPDSMARSFNNIDKMTRDLSSITTQIKDGPGTLNSLIYDNSAYVDIKTLLGGAKRNKVLKFFIRESIKNSDP